MSLVADEKAVEKIIDQQEWLTPVAEAVAGAVEAAYEAAGPAKKPIENALNGVWLGHTLHPAVTDVPIGAWTAAAVMDVMEASGNKEIGPGADAAVAIGLVGAAGAALTGLTQWYPIQGDRPRKIGITHALINTTATLCYLGSWAARRAGERQAGRALGWFGFGLSMAGAYLGGSLSYSEKLGVDHAPREKEPKEFTPVLEAAELSNDRPTKAEANGVPLVLVKHGETIHVLADACSHLGGPLSEGQLEGDCITCPWHGSRFRLDDGAVVDGPATYRQPCFEARVREGKVEVRAK